MYDFSKLDGMYSLVSSAMKTPYQLDLEVKDRKPDIVPKVGDKVKIKSREWYEKWKNEDGSVTGLGTHCLIPTMSEHCGAIFEISFNYGTFFTLRGIEKGWTLAMFEEVYPQKLSTGDGFTKASDANGTFIGGLGKGSSVASVIPAINPAQGIGMATDWSKVVLDDPAIITLPNNLFSRGCTQVDIEHLRSKWGLNKEPELQTIKKHRFIKLEKL